MQALCTCGILWIGLCQVIVVYISWSSACAGKALSRKMKGLEAKAAWKFW